MSDSLRGRLAELADDLDLEAAELYRSAKAANSPAVADANRREARRTLQISDRIRRELAAALDAQGRT